MRGAFVTALFSEPQAEALVSMAAMLDQDFRTFAEGLRVLEESTEIKANIEHMKGELEKKTNAEQSYGRFTLVENEVIAMRSELDDARQRPGSFLGQFQGGASRIAELEDNINNIEKQVEAAAAAAPGL